MNDSTPDSPLPLKVPLDAGTHAVCACGRTATPPLCDGSHRGTDARPTMLTLDAPLRYAWCRCGRSAKHPTCDGTHRGLAE